LIRAVRAFISRSRTRYSACRSCCAADFTGTKRMVGLVMATAAPSSDLVPVLPKAACPIMGATAGFHANECEGRWAINAITCAR